ncbi:uncharacterized protein LOC134188384 [Corticium candelabrum]|uniref:uncharacterized protein LOC134188384 n=1 Tax=Corticium candelabrum TaxID=121492 RepID=UPI002E259D0E|nr:uncharacterized protein LOC134188384 [Corticium candelabrum]
MAERDTDVNRPPPHLEGFLYKQDPPQGFRIGKLGWKYRYFVVIKDRIYYYGSKDSHDKQHDPKGVIFLQKVSEVYETTFQSVPKKKHVNCGFSITTDERTYNLVAETHEEMRQWVTGLLYIKQYWPKQEIARNTVIDEQKYARLAMEDEEMDDTIESSYCLYGVDEESDSSPTMRKRVSTDSSGSFPINVWMIGGKRKVVNLSVRTGTAQDIIDKLSTALSSSACNVWHVDKEGQVQVLSKSENVAMLRSSTHSVFAAELLYRVLVVFFSEGKFEPLLVPYNITAQKVVALDAVRIQLDALGVNNAGLCLCQDTSDSSTDQYFSPDDPLCDVFFGKDDQNQVYVKPGTGYLFAKNKTLFTDQKKRPRVRTFSNRDNAGDIFKKAAEEKKRLDERSRLEVERTELIRKAEEERKRQKEREQERARRQAREKGENDEKLVMIEKYYDQSKKEDSPPDKPHEHEDYKQRRKNVTKHDTDNHSADSFSTGQTSRAVAETLGRHGSKSRKRGDVERPAVVVEEEKEDETQDEPEERREEIGNEKIEGNVDVRIQEESGGEERDQQAVMEKTESVTSESSSTSDEEISENKQKPLSQNSQEETAASVEEQAMDLAAAAASRRRSSGFANRRSCADVLSEGQVKASDLLPKTEEEEIKEGNASEPEFVFVSSSMAKPVPKPKPKPRVRERTPDEMAETKAAALAARQSVQRQKSPPVAIGSAEAAARLATGQVVEKVESDIIPARRGQLGKEEKQRRWTGKRTISKKEDVKEENTDNPVSEPESRSDLFGARLSSNPSDPGRSRSHSNSPPSIRGSWKSQMDEDDRVISLINPPQVTPETNTNTLEELDRKVKELEKKQMKTSLKPRKPTDIDVARLLNKQTGDIPDGPVGSEVATGSSTLSSAPTTDAPIEVKSTAFLKVVLKQSTQLDGSSASLLSKRMDFISLSGTQLRNHGGVWHLEPGSAFHISQPDINNCEVITIPPHIRATFSNTTRQWNVKSTQPLPVRQSPVSSPVHDEQLPVRDQKTVAQSSESQNTINTAMQIRRSHVVTIEVDLVHKRGIVQGVDYVVSQVIQHFSSTRDAQEKEVLGDDSKTEAIGHLVRGPFCSAVAALITDGMKRFRMGGLVRNNLWHVVQASVAKSDNKLLATAIRVVDDLKRHPLMFDDNMRYRTFICASLNHYFLEAWLIEMTMRNDFLFKYYEPYALLRLSSGPATSIFNELLISMQPLIALPFRLYSAFESQQAARYRQRQAQMSENVKQEGESNEERQSVVNLSEPVVASNNVEAHSEPDGLSSPSREALVESLTHMQQSQVPNETDDLPPEMTIEEQDNKKSGRVWGAVVAFTSSVSQATVDMKESIQSYLSKAKSSTSHTLHSREVRAVYNSNVDGQDELPFSPGDVLTVQEQINDDWLICRLGDRTGLVPTNHVVPV